LSDRPVAGSLEEGWYLMSVADLERELLRWRGDTDVEPSNALRLTTEEAVAYRNRGNVPDEYGRSLRLVLMIEKSADLDSLDTTRLRYEPDYHDPPEWRRPGSVPINVVPLRKSDVTAAATGPWWEEPGLAELEREWQESGRVAGVAVPAEYRGFVYKTVLSLRESGKDVSVASVADSISRWLPREDAARIRRALEEANSSAKG
jgi:hypothetical protein